MLHPCWLDSLVNAKRPTNRQPKARQRVAGATFRGETEQTESGGDAALLSVSHTACSNQARTGAAPAGFNRIKSYWEGIQKNQKYYSRTCVELGS